MISGWNMYATGGRWPRRMRERKQAHDTAVSNHRLRLDTRPVQCT
ncbi:hypothetical protein QJQ58_00185 [Paenibacillus dendritiformis]|nr:hypothetical protein [Paenibacillus dendritiformis]WGU94734.1 hypothetical protein QJQ58_00185 [Paenibacillus dendritiformis]